ncbi:unnamed protein product [Somion occarium]|uniref:ER membrane protein complex subunit 2 n=1 Tax=Somion occarium TaxID=3059160 RepID=A0ABP1DSB3_9APHY
MELSSSLQKLGAYQPRKNDKSQQLLSRKDALLKTYVAQGDEGWDLIEKLALAALDQGEVQVADECLKLLSDKFPGSPRVEVLTGIRMEVTESSEIALSFYDELLATDSSNAAIWRRKAAVLRRQGKIDQAVQELSSMLDTFYTEVEGWIELADLYNCCHQTLSTSYNLPKLPIWR